MEEERAMRGPASVFLYRSPGSKTLHADEIADYLNAKLGRIPIHVRDDFLLHHLSRGEWAGGAVAEKLAGSRVQDPANPDLSHDPFPAEVDFERRFIQKPESKPVGGLYDGLKILQVFRRLIPDEECTFRHLHIVFTHQLVATFDPKDRRYHARVGLYSLPCILSTAGAVEGPAKPIEYYLLKQQYATMGMAEKILDWKEGFSDRFLDYDDPRMTEVLKGYALQALFFHTTGNPFCEDPHCRLYNAHRQEEMLHAQITSPYELCSTHEAHFKK